MSVGVSFRARAFSLNSPSSLANSKVPLRSTSRITGTTSPSGVSTATPMLKYFLRIRFSRLRSSDALKSGNCLSAATDAFNRKAIRVSRKPCFFASSFISLRKASSSVMSASS